MLVIALICSLAELFPVSLYHMLFLQCIFIFLLIIPIFIIANVLLVRILSGSVIRRIFLWQ